MRIYNFLHTELLSPEAPDVIRAKVEKLDELKELYYELNEKRDKLEKLIAKEEKELNSIRGVLYDYVDEPEAVVPVEKQQVNILLKGVSTSKF